MALFFFLKHAEQTQLSAFIRIVNCGTVMSIEGDGLSIDLPMSIKRCIGVKCGTSGDFFVVFIKPAEE